MEMSSNTTEESTLLSEEKSQKHPDYDAIFGNDEKTKKYSTKTAIGSVRNPQRFGIVEWLFIGLSLIAFLGTLAITIERLVKFQSDFNSTANTTQNFRLKSCNNWTCTSDFTFAILLIVNLVFCLFYAIDGVVRERGFELLAVPVATVIVLVYIIGNYIYQGLRDRDSTDDFNDPLRIARLVLACVFGTPLALLSFWIYIKNGRLQFDTVGGNRMLMKIYHIRSFAITLLTFNLHLVSNFVVLVTARQLTFITEVEQFMIFVFIFYVVIITPIGWVGFNYEMIWLSVPFGALFLPTVTYYSYKIIDVGGDIKDYWDEEGVYNQQPEMYKFISISLFVVSGLGVLVYVLVLIFSALAVRDFGKGLNDKVEPPFSSLFQKFRNYKNKQQYINTSTP